MLKARNLIGKMSLPARYLPGVNRSMTKLDKSSFTKTIPLVVVSFPDPKNISVFSSCFKDEILRIPRIPHVIKLNTSEENSDAAQEPPLKKKTVANDNHVIKGILLKDSVTSVDDVALQLSLDAQEFLRSANAEVIGYDYKLNYDFYKAEEILKAILPEEYLDEVPSGFTVTGHIAHLNLRKEFKPFGALIGQVILDKNRQIETVVDKVDSIATKFRTFEMKVLAGRDDLLVTQKESNCSFTFNFSKVYWNSRLHTEHERLVRAFKPGQVVCDVFAGVGPFAIPGGKKEVFVLANDLNPESYNFMCTNIKDNKVEQFVKPNNLDGKHFINKSPLLLQEWIAETSGKIVVPDAKKYKNKTTGKIELPPPRNVILPKHIHHYVMNLPDSALSFLSEFVGLYSRHGMTLTSTFSDADFTLPWIHCHCFEKYEPEESPEPTMEILHDRIYNRILKIMDTNKDVLQRDGFSYHLVRKVAPTKPMFCVSFQLPQSLAFKEYI
ncbi:tRNA (guanine) methyltransferase Ecym_3225 [Eremothecium cymbalariae DBVPG|uniref:tRNA (guanine(37)-N1)-methyltransferase n=1 Tax=Eremothecium cymbalariae (strain CBS 270.75 / DBVPG 7215 / KCTC 17166 / NRRL Y-17582) TaxID=931890 RepID=G8JRF3_ERECY|nr:Hypothetical protein Ecym_3225 [Eremothecium cymbalariae DBVPG\